ncbi:MAG: hypothetical protein NVSMB14_06830 [Isosphaeraceae bacterium]
MKRSSAGDLGLLSRAADLSETVIARLESESMNIHDVSECKENEYP